MIPPPAGGFVLSTLSILASGYIIHDAPICRLLWPKSVGYVLYFRIITTGLALVLLLTVLLYVATIHDIPLLLTKLTPEYAPILAFPLALVIRMLATLSVRVYGRQNPEWEENLTLKTLDEKGLDQFIYERIKNKKMIMVTLENKKVYTGWPIKAPNNEDDKWLRLVPQWSGYRDEKSTINVEIDYSKAIDILPLNYNHRMLIPVEKIVTVQPFDAEIFQKFNQNSS